MKEFPDYCSKLLDPDDAEFVQTQIISQGEPKLAVQKYQELLKEYRQAIGALEEELKTEEDGSLTASNLKSKIEQL